MRSMLVATLAVGALLAGCAAPPREPQVQSAAGLPAEHFRSTATVEDSSQEGIATISTIKGDPQKRGLRGGARGDNYLRAFIDKKTGRTSIQLFQIIYYVSAEWNFYDTISFETARGMESRPLTVFKRDYGEDCAGARYGCTHIEHVEVDLDEALLRGVATRQQAGQAAEWRFRFSSRSGKEYQDTMSTAEAAGLLEAIDAYRAAKGVPVPRGS